jgi:hypothetical protein
VFNVSRRFVDLLISVFIPVRRYRCISMQCSWEGNLRDYCRLLACFAQLHGDDTAR